MVEEGKTADAVRFCECSVLAVETGVVFRLRLLIPPMGGAIIVRKGRVFGCQGLSPSATLQPWALPNVQSLVRCKYKYFQHGRTGLM